MGCLFLLVFGSGAFSEHAGKFNGGASARCMCVTMCAFVACCCTLAPLLIALLCLGDMSHHVTTHDANSQVKVERNGLPLRSFGALLVPDISSEFYKAQVTHLDGTPLLLAGLISTGQGLHKFSFFSD